MLPDPQLKCMTCCAQVELKRLVAARGIKDVVYIRSRSRVTAAPGSNPFKRLVTPCPRS